MTNSLT